MTRHTELQKIEKAIVEVRDLFIRISTLVMEQQEGINRIEDFATKISTRVVKGEKAIDKARKLRIKAIKVNNKIKSNHPETSFIKIFYFQKKTWLWIWIIGILLVIIILMALF